MMVQPLLGKTHSSHVCVSSGLLPQALDLILRDRKATGLFFALGEESNHGVPLALLGHPTPFTPRVCAQNPCTLHLSHPISAGGLVGAFHWLSELRQGDAGRDPARPQPQRPLVVRGGGAAGLAAWGSAHVPAGQRVADLLIRGLLHRAVLRLGQLKTGTRRDKAKAQGHWASAGGLGGRA